MTVQGEETRRIVHDELERASSWRRNGHPLGVWLARLGDRMLPLASAVIVFTAGGCWYRTSYEATQALQTAQEVLERERALSSDYTSIAERIQALTAVVDGYGHNASTRMDRLRHDLTAIQERLEQSVTRGEHREDVWQAIIPRLDRIEAQVKALDPDEEP